MSAETVTIKERKFIAVAAFGGTCVGCAGRVDARICYQLRLKADCKDIIWRDSSRYDGVDGDRTDYGVPLKQQAAVMGRQVYA